MTLSPNIEDGMPLVLTFPEEGTGYEIGGMGIIKDAEASGRRAEVV